MDSVQHYDSTRGEKFFTFAYHYIKLSVYRYYDFSGQTLRIPAYMRKRIRDFIGERDRLREKPGQDALCCRVALQEILSPKNQGVLIRTQAVRPEGMTVLYSFFRI